MDRDKKVFLCVKSLMNISMDLKEEYRDFSDMILFIADKIAQKEQEREKKGETYQIYDGNGKEHDLKTPEDLAFGPVKCDEDECEIVPEEDVIEKEIDNMIQTVRKEMISVSD